jgi:hypothetical protein
MGMLSSLISVRVLGKPGGCAEISGYAFGRDRSLMVRGLSPREPYWGQSGFVNATDIFEVDYCPST